MPEQRTYSLGACLTFHTYRSQLGGMTSKRTEDIFSYFIASSDKQRSGDIFSYQLAMAMRWHIEMRYKLGVNTLYDYSSTLFDFIYYLYYPELVKSGKTDHDTKVQAFAYQQDMFMGFSGDDKIEVSLKEKKKLTIALLIKPNTQAYTLLSCTNRNDVPFFLRTNTIGDQLIYCNGDFENRVSFQNPMEIGEKYLVLVQEDKIYIDKYDDIDENNAYYEYPRGETFEGFGLEKEDVVFGEGYGTNFHGTLYGMMVSDNTLDWQAVKAIFKKTDLQIQQVSQLESASFNWGTRTETIKDQVYDYLAVYQTGIEYDKKLASIYRVTRQEIAGANISVQNSITKDSDIHGLSTHYLINESSQTLVSSQIESIKDVWQKNLSEFVIGDFYKQVHPVAVYIGGGTRRKKFISQLETIRDVEPSFLARFGTGIDSATKEFVAQMNIVVQADAFQTINGLAELNLSKDSTENGMSHNTLTQFNVLPPFTTKGLAGYYLEKWNVSEEAKEGFNYGSIVFGSEFAAVKRFAEQVPEVDEFNKYYPYRYGSVFNMVYSHRMTEMQNATPVQFDVIRDSDINRWGSQQDLTAYQFYAMGPVVYTLFGRALIRPSTVFPLESDNPIREGINYATGIETDQRNPAALLTGIEKQTNSLTEFNLFADYPVKNGSVFYITRELADDIAIGTVYHIVEKNPAIDSVNTGTVYQTSQDFNSNQLTVYPLSSDKLINSSAAFQTGIDYLSKDISMFSVVKSGDVFQFNSQFNIGKTQVHNQLGLIGIESEQPMGYSIMFPIETDLPQRNGSLYGIGIDAQIQEYLSEMNIGIGKVFNGLGEFLLYGDHSTKYLNQYDIKKTAQTRNIPVIFKIGAENHYHGLAQYVRWGIVPTRFLSEYTIEPIHVIQFRVFNPQVVPKYSQNTENTTIAELLEKELTDEMD